MAYITSRGFQLPQTSSGMDDTVWFNMWVNKLWPYEALQPGDDLYWYESPSKQLVWETTVTAVEAFPFQRRDAALDHLDRAFGVGIDRTPPYLSGKPNSGYCVGFTVEARRRLAAPKPPDLRFNQQGWERDTRPEVAAWLAALTP